MTDTKSCQGCGKAYARNFARCPFCNAAATEGAQPPDWQFPAHLDNVDGAPGRPAPRIAGPNPARPQPGRVVPGAQQHPSPDNPVSPARQAAIKAVVDAAVAGGRKKLMHDMVVGGALRLLAKAGVWVLIVGALSVACEVAFTPKKSVVGADDLMNGPPENEHVLLNGSLVDWDAAIVFDPNSPVQLRDPGEVTLRAETLRGRLVKVPATPLAAYIMRTIITDKHGVGASIDETQTITRIYAPLVSSGAVWAVSQPVKVESIHDGVVKQMGARTMHTGIALPLHQFVDLALLRNPRLADPDAETDAEGEVDESGARPFLMQGRIPVPDNAIAITEVGDHGVGDPVMLGPLMGTERTIWVSVRGAHHPPDDAKLYGKYAVCPDGCRNFMGLITPNSRGVLTIDPAHPGPPSGVGKGSIVTMVLGVLMMAGAFRAQKKMVQK